MRSILLLSGPNLAVLGQREPEIYGTTTLDELVAGATAAARAHGFALEHHQSNHEGDLVDAVLAARDRHAALVVNPGALTHYAHVLADALATFPGPVVELHLTNPHAREPWRHRSVVAPVATGTIAGFGADGYRLAIEGVAACLGDPR